ncbi:hypothetical protein WA026_014709 [Henosepilachna vigintioctopunctata]|uniref:Uncharacterized protein n=1 Tax=Henosepilachna vigintioctopunctata TaxID=420089 RepID=A0AAW1V9U2_9CUCU
MTRAVTNTTPVELIVNITTRETKQIYEHQPGSRQFSDAKLWLSQGSLCILPFIEQSTCYDTPQIRAIIPKIRLLSTHFAGPNFPGPRRSKENLRPGEDEKQRGCETQFQRSELAGKWSSCNYRMMLYMQPLF